MLLFRRSIIQCSVFAFLLILIIRKALILRVAHLPKSSPQLFDDGIEPLIAQIESMATSDMNKFNGSKGNDRVVALGPELSPNSGDIHTLLARIASTGGSPADFSRLAQIKSNPPTQENQQNYPTKETIDDRKLPRSKNILLPFSGVYMCHDGDFICIIC